MKKIAIILGALLLVVLSVYVTSRFTRSEPTIQIDAQRIKEGIKSDSLQKVIKSLKGDLTTASTKIELSRGKIQKYNSTLVSEKERADSAEARYKRDKTSSKADSTILAKNAVILTQDSTIEELGAECEQYSSFVYKQESIIRSQEEQDSIKNGVIKRQDSTIETLICAKDWGFRHKFWKWFFGWKCKK